MPVASPPGRRGFQAAVVRLRGVLLALCLLCWASAGAQSLFGEDFDKAMEAMSEGRYIKVRRLAEKRLELDPTDFMGLYFMTKVLDQEGDSPRAYLYAGKCQAVMKERIPTAGADGGPVGALQEDLMNVRLSAAQEMGYYDEALKLIEEHDKLFANKWEAQAGWPLIKLGRHDECQRRMQKVIDKGDAWEKIVALNTLSAMHWQKGEVQKSRDYFAQINELGIANGMSADATILCNKGESELGLGNFEAAEKDYRQATEGFNEMTSSNPYQTLTLLYVDQGRFSEAASSAAKMYGWLKMSAPTVRNGNWATVRKQFATFLLAAGYPDEALPLLEELLHRQERNANTSDKPYRLECEILFLYQDCLDLLLAKQAEQRSWSSFSTSMSLWFSGLSNQSARGDAQQRLAGLIADNDALKMSLIPYQTDWVASPWLLSDLIEAVGPGVVAVQAGELEKSAGDYGKRYMKAYIGEARMRQGRYEEALPLLQAAVEQLPSQQVLLRARVRLAMAVCQEETGDSEAAMASYQKVLETDPNAFRRLGLALPVRFAVEDDGDAVAQEAASLLGSSPRFREESYGLPVQLERAGDGMKALLLSPQGSVLVQTTASVSEETPDLAVATCQRFHETALAPRLSLSRTEITGIQNSGSEALE